MKRHLVVVAGIGLIVLAATSGAQAQAQIKPITSSQVPAKPDALGSPAIDAGDYVYVSGQGPHKADGSTPSGFTDQVKQCLDNIKSAIRN